MKIALSTAHARWWPHRSGYQYARPSYRPDEYEHCRRIYLDLAPQLIADGHQVRVFEKFEVGQDCRGACVADVRRCGRYAAATVNVCHEINRWGPSLAIEFHINNGTPGNHGAFAIVDGTNTKLAANWAGRWLDAYTLAAPIEVFGQGVWTGRKAEKRWGRKWFLEHSGPAAIIMECGFVSNATDAAYLQTDAAVEAAVMAATSATQGVVNESRDG